MSGGSGLGNFPKNYSFQHKMLIALNEILKASGGGGGGGSGDASAANQLLQIAELIKNSSEETLLVLDEGTGTIVKQIRRYNVTNGTSSISYETLIGTAYTPTGTIKAASGSSSTPRTHTVITKTTAGTIPAGTLCGSVLNNGTANGTWNGISLPPNVAISWEPIGTSDTYGAMSYTATGTTFIIEYTT